MSWDCFIHGHKYQIIERHDLLDDRGSVVGKVIVSRCEICGRITVKTTVFGI